MTDDPPSSGELFPPDPMFEGQRNAQRRVTLSLSSLATEFGASRDTVARRLDLAGVQPAALHNGYAVFRLRDALRAWMRAPESGFDPDQLRPTDRHAHYKAEREKVALAVECGELVPAMEVEQRFASLFKILAESLETLPDIIERECHAPADQVAQIEKHLDRAREQLYQRIVGDYRSDGTVRQPSPD